MSSYGIVTTGRTFSFTVTTLGVDLLSAASVAVTLIVSPSFKPETGIVKLPSAPVVAVTLLPFGNVASTLELASAVPVILVAPALTAFTVGAAGGVVSGFASTLISFQPTGLEYLFSLIFEMTLALPAWILSFISRTTVSKKPSLEYDLTTAFDSSFEVHVPGIESRLIATSLLPLLALG